MADAEPDLVLGYDFGTSSLKAALFDKSGRVAASSTASYPLHLMPAGGAEQCPDDWWSAMCAATASLVATSGIAPQRIAAIGVSAQMCGVVPVDRAGGALHNGLIWLDGRSDAIARRLLRGWITIRGYGPVALLRWLRLTGGAPNLSGKDPTSKILWFREQMPELWPRIHKLLDVKDYIVQRLVGRFTTSPDCAHLTWLFDARPHRKCWSPAILRRLGLDEALLPEIRRATEIAGELGAEAARALGVVAGTPVSAGLGDVSAFALASGRRAPGALHLYIGTSCWIGAHLAKSKVDPLTKIGSVCSADARDYLLIAAQENAGTCVAWAARAMGFTRGEDVDFAAFEEAASRAVPRPDAPFFFPWLYGERVPIDDKVVRGGFANLSIEHTRSDMARAVLEGVALNLRWALQATERLIGHQETPVRLLGAAAENVLWCQIIADVLQRPIERVRLPQLGGALGAAMTAAVVAGWFSDLDQALAMTGVRGSFQPDPALASLYRGRFAMFIWSSRQIRAWHRRLARLS